MKTNRTRTRDLKENEAQRLLMQRRRRKTKATVNGQQYDTNDNFIASILKNFIKFQNIHELLNACELTMLEEGENPLLLNKKNLVSRSLKSSRSHINSQENIKRGCNFLPNLLYFKYKKR